MKIKFTNDIFFTILFADMITIMILYDGIWSVVIPLDRIRMLYQATIITMIGFIFDFSCSLYFFEARLRSTRRG